MENMGIKTRNDQIELSVVIPCYNEAEALPVTVPPLLETCEKLGIAYEMILVNNGSWDTTPDIIDSFTKQGYPVRRCDVKINQGYGLGVICGLNEAHGRYIAYMCADGQNVPEDIVKVYKAIVNTKGCTVAKIQRMTRNDGLTRTLISFFYNLLFLFLYGKVVRDVNGTPKIFHQTDLRMLDLKIKDSFLDSEVIIKAKILGFKIIEIPAVFHKRASGKSTVRIITVGLEFLGHLLSYPFDDEFRNWCKSTGLKKI